MTAGPTSWYRAIAAKHSGLDEQSRNDLWRLPCALPAVPCSHCLAHLPSLRRHPPGTRSGTNLSPKSASLCPLTGGAAAEDATNILHGAQLAIEEANAKGGIAGYEIRTLVLDNGTATAVDKYDLCAGGEQCARQAW